MGKFARSLTLMTAMAALVTACGRDAGAQVKKKETAAGGTIEINEGKDGKFRFNIRDADGKLVASSSLTGFASKDDAIKGLEKLKAILPTAKMAEGKKDDKKDEKKTEKKAEK